MAKHHLKGQVKGACGSHSLMSQNVQWWVPDGWGDCWRHGGPFPRTGTVPSLFVVASLWGMRSQAWLCCKDRRKTHRTLSENRGCPVTWRKWVWAANPTSTGQDSPLKLTALCQASERAGHSQDTGTISRGQRWPVSQSCANLLTAHSGSEAPCLALPRPLALMLS